MNKRTLIRWLQLFGAMALICVLRPGISHAERVKDLATVAGVRTNQLVGYGLVVGLNGTGDQTTQAPFTVQSIANMLAKFGVTIPAERRLADAAQERGRGERHGRAAAVRQEPDRPSMSPWPRSAMPPVCAAARC